MKLPMKVAGMCWSITFLVTAIPGFYQQTRPANFGSISTETFSGMTVLETLALSVVGSFAAGMFGYMIGDILSRPANHPKNKKTTEVSKPEPLRGSASMPSVPSEPSAAEAISPPPVSSSGEPDDVSVNAFEAPVEPD